MAKVTVGRKVHFNAAHRLHHPNWTPEKNQEVFGLCNNENYHGHNYDLIVKVSGEPDPDTGFVYDMKRLKDLVTRHVLHKFDHKNLNLDTEEFQSLNPTAENIAIVIWKLLREEIDQAFDLNVVVYETERNFVEFSG